VRANVREWIEAEDKGLDRADAPPVRELLEHRSFGWALATAFRSEPMRNPIIQTAVLIRSWGKRAFQPSVFRVSAFPLEARGLRSR
jgi:hypothetical protein